MTNRIDLPTPYFRRHNIRITHLLGKNGNSSVEISRLLEIFFRRDGCRFCHRLQVILIIKLIAFHILRIIAQTDPVYRNIESSFAGFSTLWSVHPRKASMSSETPGRFLSPLHILRQDLKYSPYPTDPGALWINLKRCQPIFSQSLELGKQGKSRIYPITLCSIIRYSKSIYIRSLFALLYNIIPLFSTNRKRYKYIKIHQPAPVRNQSSLHPPFPAIHNVQPFWPTDSGVSSWPMLLPSNMKRK